MSTEFVYNREKTIDGFASERVDALHNSLLGNYTHEGEYVITGKVLKELLNAKKYITHVFNNSIFCSAFIKDKKQLNFEITFKKQNKKLISEMYLLENVSKVNGYFSNTIKTIISRYTDEENKKFQENTKKFFNVVKKLNIDDGDDDGEMTIDESFYTENLKAGGIISKIDLTSLLLNELKKSHEKNAETIFKSKLKVLKKNKNPFGEKVLEEFNLEYSKIERHFFVDEEGKVRFKGLNELLDKAVESVSGTDKMLVESEKEYRDLIEKETKIFASNTLENEAKAIAIVGAKAVDSGQDNIIEAIRDIKIENTPQIISLESSGGATPFPISEMGSIKKSEDKTYVEKEQGRQEIFERQEIKRSDSQSANKIKENKNQESIKSDQVIIKEEKVSDKTFAANSEANKENKVNKLFSEMVSGDGKPVSTNKSKQLLNMYSLAKGNNRHKAESIDTIEHEKTTAELNVEEAKERGKNL